MKIFQITSWSVFFLGIIFQLLHLPGGGMFCASGFMLLFLFAVVFLFKNVFFKKENKEGLSALMHFAFAFLTLYLLHRILFWPGVFTLLTFATFLILIYFVVFFAKNKPFKLPQFLLSTYFIISIFLWNIPTHQIYYFKHSSTLGTWDFRAWKMYSWFLYTDGKEAEAIEANHKAQELVLSEDSQDLDNIVTFGNSQGMTYREVHHSCLQLVEQKILDKTWTDPDYVDCFLAY